VKLIEIYDESESQIEAEEATDVETEKTQEEEEEKYHETDIIIEPYDEDEEGEEEHCVILNDKAEEQQHEKSVDSSHRHFGSSSNELFLKSLQATLDNLSDERNMRARIKIQEVLYQVAYDN